MQSIESVTDAIRIANKIISGDIDPNVGCGLIAEIGEKLKYPNELDIFMLLAHDQTGHEFLGITKESCIPDILSACRDLVQDGYKAP